MIWKGTPLLLVLMASVMLLASAVQEPPTHGEIVGKMRRTSGRALSGK